MKIYRPLWNEGALLSPQQFQQQAEWESFRNAGVSALASPFPWGVEKIGFNESLLSSGLIQISQLRLWLEDGSLIDAQRSDLPPPPRELDPVLLAGMDAVTVVIALPHMQPGVVNVEQEGIAADRSLDYDLDAIPGYDHAEPVNAFPPLFDLVTELLETSLPSRVIALEMSRPDRQSWRANLHDIRLREEADLYLSVRSDIPAWQIADQFPSLCQAGSPDDVNTIYGAALRGIPLIPVSRIPAALPVRMENQYFALDMESVNNG